MLIGNLVEKWHADPNMVNDKGLTPLHLSLGKKKIDSTIALVVSGANTHIPGKSYLSAISLAEKNGMKKEAG